MRRPAEALAGVPPPEVLSADAFAFMVDRTLRHACRSNEYATLITLQASRDFVGLSIDVDLPKFDEVAAAIAPAVREIDFFGALTDRRLALLVVDAGEATARRVVERIADQITLHALLGVVDVPDRRGCLSDPGQ